MRTYIYIILAGIFIACTMYLSDRHAQELMRVADCVYLEAIQQDYAGNPYSRDAWDLFAPTCQ